jgi:hypothetical protein
VITRTDSGGRARTPTDRRSRSDEHWSKVGGLSKLLRDAEVELQRGEPHLRLDGHVAVAELVLKYVEALAWPVVTLVLAVHTYLFVDGLDVVARSDSRRAGLDPSRLLRPGGPLYPTDTPCTVDVQPRSNPSQGPTG